MSQTLTVEALPEIVIGPTGERIRTRTRGVRRAVPKAGTPGIVPNIEFFDRTATSVSVRWGQPSDGGPGKKLTGFGLKFWKEGTQEPGYDPEDMEVVGPPPTPSEYTKTGMERGARYNFRIHACNGTDSCGYWTHPPKKVGVPLMPHTISVEEKKGTSARVKWSPEADTGGVALTGFAIRWRVKDTSWPTQPQAPNVPHGDRRYTMSPLTANTTYQVSLQSCNARDSCSPWTEPLEFGSLTHDPQPPFEPTAAPTAAPPMPVNPQPPSVSPACELAPGSVPGAPAPPSGTVLDTPTNLAVEPMLNRKALLTWANVQYAEGYVIEARRRIVDPITGPRWTDWQSPSHPPGTSGSTTEPDNCYTIILNNILRTNTRSYGVKDSPAFSLRVVAKAGRAQDSPASEVIVVDNIITVANGHIPSQSPGGPEPQGQVELTWKSVPVLLSGDNYSGGDTFFRYRRAQGNHDSDKWVPGSYDAAKTEIANDNTIQPLDHGKLYGVQLIYVKDGKPSVFSAEESYVWSWDEAARGGQRVAGLPVQQTLPPDNTYHYRVCEETFDIEGDIRKMQWLALIKDVADKWEAATNNLVHAEEEAGDCTEYSVVIGDVVKEIARAKNALPSIDKDKLTTHIKAFLGMARYQLVVLPNDLDEAAALAISRNLAIETRKMDRNASEIILFDDQPDTPSAKVAAEVSFKQIGRLIGYSECWDPAQRGVSGENRALMCAVTDSRADGKPGKTTDIVIYRYAYSEPPNVKSLEVAPANPVLHPCVTELISAYGGVLHEFGHALGIGDGHEVRLKDMAVMASAQPNCAPYPLDLVAIYALYQHSLP